MANKLAQLAQSPEEAYVGSGMANMAKSTVSLRAAYNDYVIESQSNGETPKPFDEWAKLVDNT
jgi:hypothetical protein